jgi:hypothetical protein
MFNIKYFKFFFQIRSENLFVRQIQRIIDIIMCLYLKYTLLFIKF